MCKSATIENPPTINGFFPMVHGYHAAPSNIGEMKCGHGPEH